MYPLLLSSSLNVLFSYTILYLTPALSGNFFLNLFLMGISDTPANMLGWLMSSTVGRRWSQVFGFLVAAICMAIIITLPGEENGFGKLTDIETALSKA